MSEDQRAAVEAIKTQEGPFFLTGEAGSGKSFVIEYLRRTQPRCMVTAMTGSAAQLISGTTLHKFAGIHPVKGVLPFRHINSRVRECDLLIIDEISMASFEVLQQLHDRFDQAGHWPKLLMVGDFLQVPPVEGEKLFEADDWVNCTVLRLTQQHRQSDPAFIGPLNDIRVGKLTDRAQAMIESCRVEELPDDCVHLVAHRATAQNRNNWKLNSLPGNNRLSVAEINVSHDSKGKPRKVSDSDRKKARFQIELRIKERARVVMLTNDKEERWVNGTTGTVKKIEKGCVCILLDSGREVEVKKETEEILDGDNNPLYTVTQYPFMLAWALTVHRAQGMTLDRVGVDLNGHFVTGQTYVALSRCRTREGLFVVGEVKELLVDPAALELWNDGGQLPAV